MSADPTNDRTAGVPSRRSFTIHSFAAVVALSVLESSQVSAEVPPATVPNNHGPTAVVPPAIQPIATQTSRPTPPPPPPGGRMGQSGVAVMPAIRPVQPGAAGVVRLASINTDKGLDLNTARTVVMRYLSRFRQCYTATLATTPTASGTVAFQATIDATGRASMVMANSANPTMRTVGICGRTVLRMIAFPTTGATAQLTFNMAFVPPPPVTHTRPPPSRRRPSGGRM